MNWEDDLANTFTVTLRIKKLQICKQNETVAVRQELFLEEVFRQCQEKSVLREEKALLMLV